MKDKVKFYVCPICGNVIELIDGNIEHITCCGRKMDLLVAGTVDASVEKHLPVFEKVGDEVIVKVGEVIHPMDDDHYIMWIACVMDDNIIRVNLNPGDDPCAKFKYVAGSELYAYCNKHGLWKTIV